VGIPLKFLVVLDPEANTLCLYSGFVIAEFSDREGALRFARARGLKLMPPSLALAGIPIRQQPRRRPQASGEPPAISSLSLTGSAGR
jgi:hypothetical protein